MYGYGGKMLRINLKNKSATVEPLKDSLIRRFIGGRGFGIKVLWDEVPAGVDPLGPENKLVISVGPLTGTKVQSASRWVAQFKSPLTGIYCRSVGGGCFGAELKFAGYDAIVVGGKSEKSTYVWINDDNVEFRDASKVWGLNTMATRDILLEETDRKARMVTIGPAGEKLVKFSSIVTDDTRTAGRGGGGAVMGSKNLKAIVVKGSKRPDVYDERTLDEAVNEQLKAYREWPAVPPADFRRLGTNTGTYVWYVTGHFPTYNFQQREWEGIERFRPEILESYIIGHKGCYACAMRCGKIFRITNGPYAGIAWEFPELETEWSLGGIAGVNNIEAITYANMLCDLYGLDTISTGVAIAFAIELCEKSIIDKTETDGLDLSWGKPEVIVELVRRVALRIGNLGNLLAEGVRRAAEIIGRGAEKYAMHIKGLEMPAYDPRAMKGQGLGLVTGTIGGSHAISWNKFEILGVPKKVDPFTVEGKAELTKYVQDEMAVCETAVFCKLIVNHDVINPKFYSRVLYAVTGIETFKDPKYLWTVGERIWNLERMFNVREGVDGKYDTLPERLLKEPHPRNPAKGQTFELDRLLKDYYKVRGWNEQGIPTKEKLAELEIS
ncbi:aldehyde ferredoxin oxidoreductase family protein [Candidatus Bathyarchaeota archaeon]|nr:aldehyde ferredoxin oxidoreductase family protein [Candidatus Bathyarchaeota archaeon]